MLDETDLINFIDICPISIFYFHHQKQMIVIQNVILLTILKHQRFLGERNKVFIFRQV